MEVYKFTYFPEVTKEKTEQPSLTFSTLQTASLTKGMFSSLKNIHLVMFIILYIPESSVLSKE